MHLQDWKQYREQNNDRDQVHPPPAAEMLFQLLPFGNRNWLFLVIDTIVKGRRGNIVKSARSSICSLYNGAF
jgi:hypothetical protein